MSVSRITVVVRMSVRTPEEVTNAVAIVLVIYFMLINMNALVREYFCMIINIYYYIIYYYQTKYIMSEQE